MRKVAKFIRKLIWRFDIQTFYFSQSGEDASIAAIFRRHLENQYKGFFIDIGAYHPYKGSNTYIFYREGWRGINIDARPNSMAEFKKLRPEDINIEMGIGNSTAVLPFYMIKDKPGMNSFSLEAIKSMGLELEIEKVEQVRVSSLENLLDSQLPNGKKIDLMNIDVEGFDYEVLISNNWEKYKPSVICLETEAYTFNDLIKNKSVSFLIDKGYDVVGKTIITKDITSVILVSREFKW